MSKRPGPEMQNHPLGAIRTPVRAWARRTAFLLAAGLLVTGCNQPDLTPYDMKRAKEFVLSSLPALPPDPSNAFGDNPQAASFGEQLFFDTSLSANEEISCASCHKPELNFQDGLPVGVGLGTTPRRTMPLEGVQWGAWFFWDGRKDSQWSQALEPFETPAEHGLTRDMVARKVLVKYSGEYEALFGDAPTMNGWPFFASPLLPGVPMENWYGVPEDIRHEINTVFGNIGKALAAYQRTLLPRESRFDRFFEARMNGREVPDSDQLSADEIEGFKLFTGKARCDNCHSGPLFTDDFFHNTGVPIANSDRPDYGRAPAVLFLKKDIFSCLGDYSDAKPEECRELNFMSEDPAVFEGAFKTPGLRGVSARPPFMHAGQIKTLEAVVDHYVAAPDPFFDLPELDGTISEHGKHTEVPDIELTDAEKSQLVAFLKTL